MHRGSTYLDPTSPILEVEISSYSSSSYLLLSPQHAIYGSLLRVSRRVRRVSPRRLSGLSAGSEPELGASRPDTFNYATSAVDQSMSETAAGFYAAFSKTREQKEVGVVL